MIARLGRSALRVRPRDVAVAVAARTRLSSAAPAAAPQPPAREAARDALGRAYATGRRKSSSARVWVFPGDGRVRVNGRNMVEYFKRATHVDEVIKPFLATKTACAFDVRATVAGGGLSGQAGAIRLGVARALPLSSSSSTASSSLTCAIRDGERVQQCGVVTVPSRATWVELLLIKLLVPSTSFVGTLRGSCRGWPGCTCSRWGGMRECCNHTESIL